MTLQAWHALAGDPTPDKAWSESVALIILDAAASTASSDDLIRFRGELADTARRAQEVIGQIQLMLVQLDALIGRSRAHELLAISATGRRGDVISALRQMGGSAFASELVESTHMDAAHLSRACSELAEVGLIQRHRYGKRVEWSLTRLADAIQMPRSQPLSTETEPPARNPVPVSIVPVSRVGETLRLDRPIVRAIDHRPADVHDSAWVLDVTQDRERERDTTVIPVERSLLLTLLGQISRRPDLTAAANHKRGEADAVKPEIGYVVVSSLHQDE